MKIILFYHFVTAVSLGSCSQATTEYQYAIARQKSAGNSWKIFYEDTALTFETGIINPPLFPQITFKLFHYMNRHGYEPIGSGKDPATTDGTEYYFKRPKRK